MMFVEVRSSTAFAEWLRPIEVVTALNRHGGHVDRF
jgi:hypothetical protein